MVIAALAIAPAVWLAATGAPRGPGYWALVVGFSIGWLLTLTLVDTRSYRVIGNGSAEFKRVWDATLLVFAVTSIIALAIGVGDTKPFLLIGIPVGLAALFIERFGWRGWLKAKRRRGHFSARVLVVGSGASVNPIVEELLRNPSSGYEVVGVCVPSEQIGATAGATDIPVLGNVSLIGRALEETGADTVIVTGADELPPEKVKEISWGLEAGRQHLILAPSILDIAGPRIHTRPVAGLPLIHVETPRFSRAQRLIKRSFDLASSALLVLMLSPVLIALAVLVKMSSNGPVLYRQERIGHHGETFQMLKFRSMRQGADAELAALLAAQGTSEQPLFKIKNDPRITPIGHILRKYSLDELPQLFNVLGGSMSLVGPRPQIAAEVALYTDAARRRLLARPGITGLWQVSGRSSLDWDQTVRLDLYYVENWSFLGDISILMRTVKAVAAPGETAH